jgi:putative ABC transport system permease protein
VRLVVSEAGILLASGLVIGIALALVLGKMATTLIFGLQFYDAAVIIVAILTLSVAATAASYIPALRASRIDPAEALRSE